MPPRCSWAPPAEPIGRPWSGFSLPEEETWLRLHPQGLLCLAPEAFSSGVFHACELGPIHFPVVSWECPKRSAGCSEPRRRGVSARPGRRPEHPPLGPAAGCTPAVDGRPSVSLLHFLWCSPKLPTRLGDCLRLPPSRPPLSGSGLPAPPWPGRELHRAPFPSPAASTLALIRPLTSHLTGSWALAFSTTLHSIRGCGESSGGPLEGGQGLRSRRLLSRREGATLGRTALVRGSAAAFTANAKPKGSWPTVRMCPSGENLVFRRNEFETGWEQLLSDFQVSSFHRELIELSL